MRRYSTRIRNPESGTHKWMHEEHCNNTQLVRREWSRLAVSCDNGQPDPLWAFVSPYFLPRTASSGVLGDELAG